MKSNIVSVVFALSLAHFALPTTARAGDIFHLRGETAQAFFTRTEGCIVTSVFLAATQGRFQSPPGPGNSQSNAFAGISQYNTCTTTPVMSAFGSRPLPTGAFEVTGRLESATLNTVIRMQNFPSGTTLDLSVALTWTGSGELSHGTNHSHLNSPGLNINNHSSGFSRPAVASGTVSDGSTNHAQGPSAFATIQKTQSGMVTIN